MTEPQLLELLQVTRVDEPVPEPSAHVRPTDTVRVVTETAAGGRCLRGARWGLVPSWSRGIPARPLINARVESVLDKPSFRVAVARRRVVVPADAYFEWRAEPGAPRARKQPYAVAAADGAPLWLAGVCEVWPDPARERDDPDRWLVSTAIVTTAAPREVAHVHDRAPLVVPTSVVEAWLDPETAEAAPVRALLADLVARQAEAGAGRRGVGGGVVLRAETVEALPA